MTCSASTADLDRALAILAGVIERREGEPGCEHLWTIFDRLEAAREARASRLDRLAAARARADAQAERRTA